MNYDPLVQSALNHYDKAFSSIEFFAKENVFCKIRTEKEALVC